MAFIQCDFYSETLGICTSMNVILPQSTRSQVGMQGTAGAGKHPVLWLLHGRSDDHTIWCRRTSIERYVAELGLAVVMPAGGLSFYSNMVSGQRFGDFFENELPGIARSFFPLSDKREDNFIAGLSMGGYGTMRLALAHPERYAAAASLSGVLDIAELCESAEPWRRSMMATVFGDKLDGLRGSDFDLLHLLKKHLTAGTDLPRLYACCGAQDFLIEHNRTFDAFCREQGVPLRYVENQGAHEWSYWDRMIQDVLAWLVRER